MTVLDVVGRIGDTGWSVFVAVLPLVALFLLFQVLFLQLPVREVTRVLIGTAIASAGLLLFLLGVGIALLPFGRAIGAAIASLSAEWLAVPFGLALGFVTTWGEPAVRILADQVEEASVGAIRRSLVIVTVCAGVALAVGAGMARIVYGIPFLYLAVPGYLFVLVVLWLCDKEYVGIAADAGGVATGPLANTFLLALAIGASAAMGGDPLVDGLGLVALIALAPVMAVLALGYFIRWKESRKEG